MPERGAVPTPTHGPGHRPGPMGIIAIVLVVLGCAWLALGSLILPGGDGWGYDFLAYRDAAVRLQETGSLYQAETLEGPYRPGPYGLYMYAPPAGIAMAPMTHLSPSVGTTLWFVLHVVALGLACALMPVRTIVSLAAFGVAALSFAVTRDVVLGNVSVLLLLPMAIAWRWLDRPIGAIAQAIAISVRPTLAILIVWQLLRRQWRAVAWTVGAGVVLVLATLPVVGIGGYLDYLAVMRNLTGVSGVLHNHDISSTLIGLGMSEQVASTALVAGYVVALGTVLSSLRRDREIGFMVSLTASLLLSPLLWDHYLAMIVLPAAFLAERGRPVALVLPLLTWLPSELYPIILLALLWLPFMARPAGTTLATSTGTLPLLHRARPRRRPGTV